MGIIDFALLLSLGAFVITFVVTSIIDFLRKKKDKNEKEKLEKEKENGSDSNRNC